MYDINISTIAVHGVAKRSWTWLGDFQIHKL